MKKQILEEIKDMKYLLNYNRGRILSEQPEVDLPNIDEELDMMTDEDNYTKWQKRMQSLSYTFESDINTLAERVETFEDLFAIETHPYIDLTEHLIDL